MNILTISNLYPYEEKVTHGLYNAQLFEQFADLGNNVLNWCLRPEFNFFKWNEIRQWGSSYKGKVETSYKPVWYFPVIGRDFAWYSYYLSLKSHLSSLSEIDLVYATWLFPDSVAAAEIADNLDVPFYIMVQGTDIYHLKSEYRRKIILKAIDKARAVICVSHNLKKALLAANAPSDKIYVIPNGVNAEMFKYRPKINARKSLISEGSLPLVRNKNTEVVLYVGHLWSIKAVNILIQAFAGLYHKRKNNNSEVNLVIAGVGPEQRKLDSLVGELQISDNVFFMGEQTPDKIAKWMNASDCLCLCSDSEGMPNVVIEALASGLPIVATNVGACEEILKREPMARLVPPRKPDLLESALDDILNLLDRNTDAEDLERKAMSIRNAGSYSWSKQAKSILTILRQ